jgi:putative transposase
MFGTAKAKDEAFLGAFIAHAAESVAAAGLLIEMLEHPERKERIALDISEKEATGDRLTHETMKRLHETWITPLDRDDIHGLISRLDDVLDLIEAVAERVVLFEIREVRPGSIPGPRDGRSWRTFLRNHTVWACDYLQVYDLWFRPIFAFFIVDVNAKHVVHVAVTRAPTQTWTAQQLRNATLFGQGPQFVIRDRDDKFGAAFDRVAKGAGARVLHTAVQAPVMDAVCERFLGSVRRECLDHIIILSEEHLRHVVAEYALSYFNTVRPHQGIGQRTPVPSERVRASFADSVTAVPVLGGLHHEYRAAA